MDWTQARAVFDRLPDKKTLSAAEIGEVVRRALGIGEYDNAGADMAIHLLVTAGVVRAEVADGEVVYRRGELPERLTPAERELRQRDAAARERFERAQREPGWQAMTRPDGSVLMTPTGGVNDALNEPIRGEMARFVQRIVQETLREMGLVGPDKSAAATVPLLSEREW